MAKQPPEQTKPTRWEIFKIASKSVWIGSVEAPDEASAILKAAEEFKIDARRLYVRGDDALRKSSTQARIEGRNPAIWPDDDYAVVDTDIPVGRIAIVDTDTPVGRIYREIIRGEPKWLWSIHQIPEAGPGHPIAPALEVMVDMKGWGEGIVAGLTVPRRASRPGVIQRITPA